MRLRGGIRRPRWGEKGDNDVSTPGRVARNSVMVFISRAVDLGLGIVSLALVSRYLGVSLYGKFVFIFALGELARVLSDFGVEHIIVREIAKGREQADRFFGAALVLRLILCGLIALAVVIFLQSAEVAPEFRIALYIVIFTQTLTSLAMLFVAIFRGFERMEYDALLSIVYRVAVLAGVCLVIWQNFGFIALFLAHAVASIVRTSLGVSILWRRFVRPKIEAIWDQCKFILRETYPLGIYVLLTMGFFKVDIFVLKSLRGPAEVGIFNVPYTIIMQFSILPIALVTALFPVFSRFAISSQDALKDAYQRTFKFLLVLSLPISVLITAFAYKIILLISGQGYVEGAVSLRILVWSINFLFLEFLISFVLVSMNRQKLVLLSMGSCFLVNLFMDIILVPHYGHLGASLGTLCAYLVVFGMLFYFVSRCLGFIHLTAVAFKPLLSALVMGICLYLLRGPNLPWSLLAGLISYPAALLLFKVFPREEINLFRKVIKGNV